MRFFVALVVFSFLPVLVCGQPTPQQIIDRAIEAQGGVERLAQSRAAHTKIKGTVYLQAPVPFTKTTFFQAPNQLCETQEVEVNGKKIVTTNVFNNNRAWINVNGQTREVAEQRLLIEMQETAHLHHVCRLFPLKGPDYELTALGESKLEKRTVVGVKAATRGFRDINLYFDRDSGLLVKTDRKKLHLVSQQETVEQTIILEYGSVQGLKWPRKMVVLMDGKKLVEGEAVGVKFFDKLDDSYFTKP